MTLKHYIFILAVLISADCFATVDRFRCMWRDNPATSMVIGFDLVSGTNPVLYYDEMDHGTDYEQYRYLQEVDYTTSGKGMNNQFIRLRGLRPNTVYYFVIKDSEGVSRRLSFQTLPDNPYERLSIIAGGDSRNHREARKNANSLVAKLRPHFVMFGGDMTGGDNSTQWVKWMNDWQETIGDDGRMTPIIVTRGNHEASNKSLLDLFDVPSENLYYALSVGGNLIRIYTLNTLISSGGDQKDWLAYDLSSKGMESRWRIAQYHYAIRPHTTSKTERHDQLKNWATLFHKYQMSLVVESDIHVVKSTYPIRPSKEKGSEQGFIRDDVTGTVYVGEGCWGAPLRKANDRKSWTRDTGSFNQFKWIFVDYDGIEVRTVKVDNAAQVASCTDENRFCAPNGIDIWHPENGPIIYVGQPDASALSHIPEVQPAPAPVSKPAAPVSAPVKKPIPAKTVDREPISKPTRSVEPKSTPAPRPTPRPAPKPIEKVVVNSFDANVSDSDEIVVKWISVDEPSGVVYDVLRSVDGKAYVTVATIKGTALRGNNNYKIVDEIRNESDRKRVSYRLGHNKKAGEYLTAKKRTSNNWHKFPKVMADKKTGLCKVKYTLENFGDVDIKMIDADENEIIANKYENKKPGVYLQTIDMRSLPTASYLVVIRTGDTILNKYRVDKK